MQTMQTLRNAKNSSVPSTPPGQQHARSLWLPPPAKTVHPTRPNQRSLSVKDRTLQARREATPALEGVEGHDALVAAGLPSLGRVAVSLKQHVVEVDALDVQDSLEALVQKHVLAPEAVPGAELPEVGHATVHAPMPAQHGAPRQHLEWPMHPQLAIVDVHRLLSRGVLQRRQPPAKPVGEEDGVRVDLDRPVPLREDAVADDLSPDVHEDVVVQRRLELAAVLALEAVPSDYGLYSRGDLYGVAAVHGAVLATKDPGGHGVRLAQQLALVAPGHHDSKAEEADTVALGGFLLILPESFFHVPVRLVHPRWSSPTRFHRSSGRCGPTCGGAGRGRLGGRGGRGSRSGRGSRRGRGGRGGRRGRGGRGG
mmetsp:Transcript_73843/g.228109  ORF Transcript_73843/g.228109 Transcript_73843/m.228109 type:complete len:368 (-) Transcript_73843:756-1859(-)